MTELLTDIHLALPEMVILVTACLALLADLFFRERARWLPFGLTVSGLFLAGVVSFLFLGQFRVLLLHGLFVSDDMAQLMKLFLYFSVFLSFFLRTALY